jgi:hypothetical protein
VLEAMARKGGVMKDTTPEQAAGGVVFPGDMARYDEASAAQEEELLGAGELGAADLARLLPPRDPRDPRDHQYTAVVLGGPGSGKSALAREVAAYLNGHGIAPREPLVLDHPQQRHYSLPLPCPPPPCLVVTAEQSSQLPQWVFRRAGCLRVFMLRGTDFLDAARAMRLTAPLDDWPPHPSHFAQHGSLVVARDGTAEPYRVPLVARELHRAWEHLGLHPGEHSDHADLRALAAMARRAAAPRDADAFQDELLRGAAAFCVAEVNRLAASRARPAEFLRAVRAAVKRRVAATRAAFRCLQGGSEPPDPSGDADARLTAALADLGTALRDHLEPWLRARSLLSSALPQDLVWRMLPFAL